MIMETFLEYIPYVLAIIGVASVLLKLGEVVAGVTQNTRDDEIVSKIGTIFKGFQTVLSKFALETKKQ